MNQIVRESIPSVSISIIKLDVTLIGSIMMPNQVLPYLLHVDWVSEEVHVVHCVDYSDQLRHCHLLRLNLHTRIREKK